MMKYVLALVILFISYFFTIPTVQAHFRGQPFVKINGKPTKLYTQDEFAKIGDIYVPSDIAPGVYLSNKKINFEIDTTVLPFPEEVTKNAKYQWDFGDGTKKEGAKVSHTYTKAGPHEVNVEIKYGDLSKFGFNPNSLPPAYQLVLVNVLPSPGYKVPKPVILINGQDVKSFQRKIDNAFLPSSAAFFEQYYHVGGIRIAKNFTFDASKSVGSTKMKEYIWYFDDDKITKSAKATRSFTNGYYLNSVGVRVKDENGFYTDTFFEVGNKDMEEQKSDEKDESPIISSNVVYGFGGGLLGLGVIASFVMWKLLKKEKYIKSNE